MERTYVVQGSNVGAALVHNTNKQIKSVFLFSVKHEVITEMLAATDSMEYVHN
jgi:hypothetical protein